MNEYVMLLQLDAYMGQAARLPDTLERGPFGVNPTGTIDDTTIRRHRGIYEYWSYIRPHYVERVEYLRARMVEESLIRARSRRSRW